MGKSNEISKGIRNQVSIGDIIESLENGIWYKAKVVEVINPGSNVRIHYQGWKSKWDKEIQLTSPSVRFIKKQTKELTWSYKVGQKVMALFTDKNKYPAEIIALQPESKYTVKFYDGIIKRGVHEYCIDRFTEKAKREAEIKADELYGGLGEIANLEKSIESPAGRSERRRRSEAESTRSGRSTPEAVRTKRIKSSSSVAKENVPQVSSDSVDLRKKNPDAENTRRSSRQKMDKMQPVISPDKLETLQKAVENLTSLPKPKVKKLSTPQSDKPQILTRHMSSALPKNNEPVNLLERVPPKTDTPSKTVPEYEPTKSPPDKTNTPKRSSEGISANKFDFSDSPEDTIYLTDSAKTANVPEGDLSSLLGEPGYGRAVVVRYQNVWHEAKVIAPPKFPRSKKMSKKVGNSIFIHYKGWAKQFDTWIMLSDENVKFLRQDGNLDKFSIGEHVLGIWTDKRYHPCVVTGFVNNAYRVEFYDGFQRQLNSNQIKAVPDNDNRKGVKPNDNGDDNIAQSGVLKNGSSSNGKKESVVDERQSMPGQKRKRPSSSPNPVPFIRVSELAVVRNEQKSVLGSNSVADDIKSEAREDSQTPKDSSVRRNNDSPSISDTQHITRRSTRLSQAQTTDTKSTRTSTSINKATESTDLPPENPTKSIERICKNTPSPDVLEERHMEPNVPPLIEVKHPVQCKTEPAPYAVPYVQEKKLVELELARQKLDEESKKIEAQKKRISQEWKEIKMKKDFNSLTTSQRIIFNKAKVSLNENEADELLQTLICNNKQIQPSAAESVMFVDKSLPLKDEVTCIFIDCDELKEDSVQAEITNPANENVKIPSINNSPTYNEVKIDSTVPKPDIVKKNLSKRRKTRSENTDRDPRMKLRRKSESTSSHITATTNSSPVNKDESVTSEDHRIDSTPTVETFSVEPQSSANLKKYVEVTEDKQKSGKPKTRKGLGKSLSALTEKLTEKASIVVSNALNPGPANAEPKKPRKSQPIRRASGTSGVPITNQLSLSENRQSENDPIMTRRSQRRQQDEEFKLMPKSVKENLIKNSEVFLNESYEKNKTIVQSAMHSPSPKPICSQPEVEPESPSYTAKTVGNEILFNEQDRKPLFAEGDHVMISSGKGATIVKIFYFKNRQYEYLLRVENGPKLKQREQELRKMERSEYVVRPILESIISEMLQRHERKQREQKKLDHTAKGLKWKQSEQLPMPSKAFAGAENEFKCTEKDCDKSFRKQRMLEAHIKHYHPHRSQSPYSYRVQRDNLSESGDATEDDSSSVISALSAPRVESGSDVEQVDTLSQKITYQCSCGWEGSEFWSQNPSGVPIRNHICQRPQKVRNLKETQMTREIYRTVDVGDYYEGFKIQVYPDHVTQELVREVNLLQNEIHERVWRPSQKIRQNLKSMKPQIEKLNKNNLPDDTIDVSFSVAEGVSLAQNAFPDTQGDNTKTRNEYTDQELTVLKNVDSNDQMLMEIFKENNENAKVLDEIEQYVIHMERDLNKKSMVTEVPIIMNN